MQKRRNLRCFLARLLVVTILLGNMGTGYLAEFWLTSALAASGAQVQTPSNADEPDSEMPSDDVTSDQQNGLSENSYLRENPGATPSSASPSGIEKETVEITAVDVVVSLGTGGFDLLDGVTARAEDGDSVPVTVRDEGGFDINTEGIYTVEYEAESVTTTRNVTVFAFDPQPATLAEVQTMADVYETAYQAAMDEGGFLSALEVQKPRWQYEVDSSLMASGWRCDYLVDETYGVTYWSFFPAPMVLVADASVGTAAELATAINSASGTGYVIEITSDIDISYLSAACTIESWQDIIIRSDTGGLWTLTQSQTDIRHFIVNANGKLTLENIVLDGSTNGGGVVVNLNGSFIMNDNSSIQSCSASQGGGVYVIGTFTMNDNAVISNNNATASGGGVYIGSSGLTGGTFNMKSGEISGNTAAFYGGGVFCYGMKQNYPVTFNMEGGKICGNKASQGGGVGLESGASSPAILTITDSVVSENEAASGSGIYAYCNSTFNAAQTLTLTRAVIANNVSTNTNGGGGGIHLSSYDNQDNTCAKQTLTVTDSKISNNEGGIGGGLCIGSASAITIKGTSIIENKAAVLGGGIAITGNPRSYTPDVKITDSSFTRNTVTGGVYQTYGGGGICLLWKGALNVDNVSFEGNKSVKNGGGIYIQSNTSTVTVQGATTFTNNEAIADGGGIYTAYPSKLTTANDTVFSGNKASRAYDYGIANKGSAGAYSNIDWNGENSVPLTHALNNYDINWKTGTPPIVYTVTFNANGSTPNPDDQLVSQGSKITKPADPDKDGYDFGGWYNDPDCTDGNEWNFVDDTITKDTELTAKWTIKTHTVVFYDEDGLTVLDSYTVNHNDNVTPPATPKKPDDAQYSYAFIGWTPGGSYAVGDSVTQDMTFIAEYSNTEQPYTVTFYDYDRLTVLDSHDVVYGAVVTAPENPVKVGDAQYSYTFSGWTPGDSGYTLVDLQSVTRDMIFTASYDAAAKTYIGTFDADGGTPEPDDQSVQYGDKLTKPEADPKKEGYTFDGWYKNGGDWDFDTDTVTGDTGLIAKWTINKYTAAFNSNGGSAVDSQVVEFGKTVTAPANPTRINHTFLGWYRDNGTFQTAWNFDSDIVTGDITLYARWAYNSSGGGGDSGGGGGTPNIPTTPTTPTPTDPEIPAETEVPTIAPPAVPPGHSIVSRNEWEYDEIDENGIPLGTWRMSDDNSTWILDEYIPLAGLPKTGDSHSEAWILLLFSCISLCGVVLSGRAERNKSGRQKDE